LQSTLAEVDYANIGYLFIVNYRCYLSKINEESKLAKAE